MLENHLKSFLEKLFYELFLNFFFMLLSVTLWQKKRRSEYLASRTGMPKSGPFGCFWPPDLRHKELKFWDKTWYTSSLGQNLEPSFFWSSAPLEPPVLRPKAPAWPADFELLRRLSELKFCREIPRLKI